MQFVSHYGAKYVVRTLYWINLLSIIFPGTKKEKPLSETLLPLSEIPASTHLITSCSDGGFCTLNPQGSWSFLGFSLFGEPSEICWDKRPGYLLITRAAACWESWKHYMAFKSSDLVNQEPLGYVQLHSGSQGHWRQPEHIGHQPKPWMVLSSSYTLL